MAIKVTLDDLNVKLEYLTKELTGKNAMERLDYVGRATVPDIDVAIETTPATNGSLRDQSMSGWVQGRNGDRTPLVLSGSYYVLSDTQVEMRPGLRSGNWRKGAGPMRVLESGRQAYVAGDRRKTGTYRSKKTGEVTVRTRKVKRATGAHRGKGTWSRAVEAMTAEMAQRWREAYVRSMGGLF